MQCIKLNLDRDVEECSYKISAPKWSCLMKYKQYKLLIYSFLFFSRTPQVAVRKLDIVEILWNIPTVSHHYCRSAQKMVNIFCHYGILCVMQQFIHNLIKKQRCYSNHILMNSRALQIHHFYKRALNFQLLHLISEKLIFSKLCTQHYPVYFSGTFFNKIIFDYCSHPF